MRVLLPSGRSPAGVRRRSYTPAPENEDEERSGEGASFSSDGGGRGGHNAGPTGDIDRGVRRPRAPRVSLPISEREFRRAILQEPLEDLEYVITLEEPTGPASRGEEDKGRVKRPGGETPGFHAPQHQLVETQARRQAQKVMVLIKKIPS